MASTALIADLTETVHRGRAIGVNDSGAGAMTVLAAAFTGPLVECSSLPAAGAYPGGTPDIPNYLWQSIAVTICCCLPFGIVGQVSLAKARPGLVARR